MHNVVNQRRSERDADFSAAKWRAMFSASAEFILLSIFKKIINFIIRNAVNFN